MAQNRRPGRGTACGLPVGQNHAQGCGLRPSAFSVAFFPPNATDKASQGGEGDGVPSVESGAALRLCSEKASELRPSTRAAGSDMAHVSELQGTEATTLARSGRPSTVHGPQQRGQGEGRHPWCPGGRAEGSLDGACPREGLQAAVERT